MGAIPKPDGDIRLIHDGSMLLVHVMNDYASQEECQYQSLQEALDLVQQGYFMAKIDLKSACRSVRIHLSNHQPTGLQWTFEGDTEPTYLIDTRGFLLGAAKPPPSLIV